MVTRTRAAGLPQAAAIAAAGAVGTLTLDSALQAFSIGEAKGAARELTIILASLLAAIVAFWVVRAWQRSSPEAGSSGDHDRGARNLAPTIIALACFFLPYLVLSIAAFLAWRRILQGKDDLVVDPKEARSARDRHQQAVSEWQQRIARFDAEEAGRIAATDVWYPVSFSETAHMTCVFGGTAASWTAALATLGASLLGSETRLTIGDLSRRLTVDVLCDVCRTAGVPATEARFPGSAAAADLFGDLDWDELSSVIAEVLHAAQQDQDASRRERTEDREVIREAAKCLDGDRPVSIGRLRNALLVIRGMDISGNGEHHLEPDEQSRLTALFDSVRPEHSGTMERVVRIERTLRDLEALDGGGPQDGDCAAADSFPPAVEGERTRLLVIGVDKQDDDLEHERFADLLFQLLLRRVRRGRAQTDVLVVLGADRIGRDRLKSLLDHAEQKRIRVVLFFESLRLHAIEIVGAGGAAAAFLPLGNHREAEEASRFIGAEHKWVVAQQTIAAGESLTGTHSWNEATSISGTIGVPLSASVGLSKTSGRSYSEVFGHNMQYTRTEQRVHEAVITPDVLMGLAPTGMIYVEVLPGGRRAAANVDCNPQIAAALRVATGRLP